MMPITESMTEISSPCDRCKHNSDRHCKILGVAIAEYPPCHYWYHKEFQGKGIEFELITIEGLIREQKRKAIA